jgi:hypothetical protein
MEDIMTTLAFLEKLADNAHYNLAMHEIVDEQALTDMQAFLNNDALFIKNQFINSETVCNVTHVVMANVTHVVTTNSAS